MTHSIWDLVPDTVSSTDFFIRGHLLIFQAIEQLANRNCPIDGVTVLEELETPAEVAGLTYLAELVKNIPSVANISIYARILRARVHVRRLVTLGYRIKDPVEQFDAQPTETKALFSKALAPARAGELRDKMLAAGLPI